MKNTIVSLQAAKDSGNKISMLTAYDYTTAKIMDEAGVNTILVGDSLGMVCLGYEDTLSVTMQDMIHHSAAVARGVSNAFIVTDLPFMSYQSSVYDAVVNAGRLMKEGRANAIKLEGGFEVCEQIKAITQASIPVFGHLGLTPQSINALGGYKVQGKTLQAAQDLIDAALAVEKAGAVALVLECVPEELATLITQKLSIPTIGIGAGANCDGQVLVYQDMLGMYKGTTAKFVKQYENLSERMTQAFQAYFSDIQAQTFPAAEHNYAIDADVIRQIQENNREK